MVKPSMGFQHAGAYLFSSRMVIVSHGRTPSGLLVQCEPFIDMPLGADDEATGQALLQSLQGLNRNMGDTCTGYMGYTLCFAF
jgi:hypothetical protein